MVCGVTNTLWMQTYFREASLAEITLHTSIFTLDGNERPSFTLLLSTVIALGVIIPVYTSGQNDKGYTLYSVRSIWKMLP